MGLVAGLLAGDLAALNFSVGNSISSSAVAFAFPDAPPFRAHARSPVVLPNAQRGAGAGHLAREYYAGLVRGFGDLLAPLADVKRGPTGSLCAPRGSP